MAHLRILRKIRTKRPNLILKNILIKKFKERKTMNELLINGRILRNTEKSNHNYVFNQGTADKKSFLRFLLSSNIEGAKKDEKTGYFPTEIYRVKAFGKTAEQINKNFGEGKYIIFKGNIAKEDAWTGTDGREFPESVVVIASK